MVGAVRSPAGPITGVHCTFLNPDGSKRINAKGETDRLIFGRVAGSAVRLAPIGEEGVLGLCEGIETALSFQALYGVPTWAALSAGGIEAFEPPAGLQRLVIAADNDPSARGLEAAQRLAKRASLHCEVHIALPGKPGDWNDVHREMAA